MNHHDRAARVLTALVAAAGITGSAIGLYSVYIASKHPMVVSTAAVVSTDGLGLVAFFCAWRKRERGYPLFVGAFATGLSMAAQYVYFSGGAQHLSHQVKGGMSAWVPLSAILAAHLLLHSFGSASGVQSDAPERAHSEDTQTGAPDPTSPLHSAPPRPSTPQGPGRPDTLPQMHPEMHPLTPGPDASEQAILDAIEYDYALTSDAGLPARMPPRMRTPSAPRVHLTAVPEPPPVPPAAPRPSAPRKRTPSAPAGTRRRTRERTDAELVSALRSAPEVRSIRSVQAHLKIGQERAKRVLELLTEED